MMLKWLTIGLTVSTLGLTATSGYLGYRTFINHRRIQVLTRANSEMSNEITTLVESYNRTLSQGIIAATSASEAAKRELDTIVNDFNATSSELAGTKAQLGVVPEQQRTIEELVNQLNAANVKVAELELGRLGPADTQKLIDELNAANKRISELEAQLATK